MIRKVTAAMNVNVPDVVDDLEAIVASRRPADPARLADRGRPISLLAQEGEETDDA